MSICFSLLLQEDWRWLICCVLRTATRTASCRCCCRVVFAAAARHPFKTPVHLNEGTWGYRGLYPDVLLRV